MLGSKVGERRLLVYIVVLQSILLKTANEMLGWLFT